MRPAFSNLTSAGLLVLMLFGSPQVRAANDTLLELLKVLRDNGTITQEVYELLEKNAMAESAGPPAPAAGSGQMKEAVKEEGKVATGQLPKIETKDQIKVTSTDGDFEWQPIGRLLVDYNLVDSDATKLGTGSEIRRARLGMEGKVWQHWIWKVDFDFANEEVSLKDGWLGYESGAWWLKLGHQYVPFSLVSMSSSKYMPFIERPLMADNILQPARRIGVSAFHHWDDFATLQAGAYAGGDGENPDVCPIDFNECDEQVSFAARATVNPYLRDSNHLLHAGGGIWYLTPQDSELKVEQRPGVFHTVDTKFQSVTFGSGAVEDVLAFNVEGAAIWGPFAAQAEYAHWDVSREKPAGIVPIVAAPDVNFDGWYVELSYFLTGESMHFKPEEAVYGSVKPNSIVGKGGIGAWQLALRFDSMDLNDAGAGVIGGDQDALSVGLNWYLTNTLRLMTDYVTVLDLTRPGNVHDDDEPSALLFRGQVYW